MVGKGRGPKPSLTDNSSLQKKNTRLSTRLSGSQKENTKSVEKSTPSAKLTENKKKTCTSKNTSAEMNVSGNVDESENPEKELRLRDSLNLYRKNNANLSTKLKYLEEINLFYKKELEKKENCLVCKEKETKESELRKRISYLDERLKKKENDIQYEKNKNKNLLKEIEDLHQKLKTMKRHRSRSRSYSPNQRYNRDYEYSRYNKYKRY